MISNKLVASIIEAIPLALLRFLSSLFLGILIYITLSLCVAYLEIFILKTYFESFYSSVRGFSSHLQEYLMYYLSVLNSIIILTICLFVSYVIDNYKTEKATSRWERARKYIVEKLLESKVQEAIELKIRGKLLYSRVKSYLYLTLCLIILIFSFSNNFIAESLTDTFITLSRLVLSYMSLEFTYNLSSIFYIIINPNKEIEYQLGYKPIDRLKLDFISNQREYTDIIRNVVISYLLKYLKTFYRTISLRIFVLMTSWFCLYFVIKNIP